MIQPTPNQSSSDSPHLALQKLTKRQITAINRELGLTEPEENEGKILCRFCHHPVTTVDKKIQMQGSHCHTFTNPSNVTFRLGCFSEAEGCYHQGKPTLEYSWFSGYTWRFSLCGNCHSHLGWFYNAATGEEHFYGLILTSLIEG